jgi:plasmid stability protein
MADVLVRDIPDDVLAALDARAVRVGLSRSEYLRRRLTQEAATTASHVALEDLSRFGEVFSDLANPDVMAQAWR